MNEVMRTFASGPSFRLRLTKEITDEVEGYLLDGDSPAIARQKVGIPSSTYHGWKSAGEALLNGEESRYVPVLSRRKPTEDDRQWERRQEKYYARCALMVDFFIRTEKAQGEYSSHILRHLVQICLKDGRNWPGLGFYLERTRDDFQQQKHVKKDVKVDKNVKYNRSLDNVTRMQNKFKSHMGGRLSDAEREELASDRLSDQEMGNE